MICVKQPPFFKRPLAVRRIEYRPPPVMKKIDIREYPELIDAINDGLNKNDDLNIKNEPKGITLVRQSRKVIYRVAVTK